MLFSGYFVDWLFRRGRHDAHLLYFAVLVPVLGLAGLAIGFGTSLPLTLAAMAFTQFTIAFIAVAAAALQIATPPVLRGRVSAMFLFIYNIVGYGVGPSAVALAAKRMGDDIAAGYGLIAMIAAPVVAILFIAGLRGLREAAAAQGE